MNPRGVSARKSLCSASIYNCIKFAVLSATMLIAGCSHTVKPVVTGSHSQLDENPSLRRAVVWSNHGGVSSAIVEWLQHNKVTVVDPASLGGPSSSESALVANAKNAGVDWVVIAEAKVGAAVSSGAYVNAYYGAERSDTVYHLAVSVRNIDVASGQVRWSGSARYEAPVSNPEQGLIYLTDAAIARATCAIERGFVWSDDGCEKR
jgi:hypothetical protein